MMQVAFLQYIKSNSLFAPKDKLLLAFSSGVDSVVLAHLLLHTGFDFALAHCNFNLRGAESDADEAFAIKFAEEAGKEIFIKKFDTQAYASEHHLSTQVAARELRYQWFEELLQSTEGKKLQLLLTAHHADDNVETVFMNFCKGTGISGLKGILPKQRHIVRPLLFASKVDIINYAQMHRLSWCNDSSNDSNKYTRNYFRNEVLPAIEKVYPQLKHNVTDNIKRFADVHEIYQQAIAKEKKSLLFKEGAEYKIPVLKLKKQKAGKTILYELLKDFGFTAHQTNDVYSLAEALSGKYVLSESHRVLRNRAWLIISPIGKKEASVFLLEKPGDAVETPIGNISSAIEENLKSISKEANVAQLNAAEVSFPLIIRKYKQGDYFYPLGMAKKKKLSRFFIDNKLSLTEKENVWVVESAKKIIWVIGHRIDNRFKLNLHATAQAGTLVLRLSLCALKC